MLHYAKFGTLSTTQAVCFTNWHCSQYGKRQRRVQMKTEFTCGVIFCGKPDKHKSSSLAGEEVSVYLLGWSMLWDHSILCPWSSRQQKIRNKVPLGTASFKLSENVKEFPQAIRELANMDGLISQRCWRPCCMIHSLPACFLCESDTVHFNVLDGFSLYSSFLKPNI